VFESDTVAATPYRVNGVADTSLADFALSARATGLTLTQPDGKMAPDKKDFLRRRTTAFVESERLGLAELPIEDDVGGDLLMLDRMVLGLQVGQPVALAGERRDLPGVTASEVVILKEVEHSGGFTVLTFKESLQHPYVRRTVSLNANVARATHGESVREVLGGGD